MNKEDVVYLYHVYLFIYFIYLYNEILFSHKKEWHVAICNNVDGSREYNAKWNKPVRERQIPYDFTHMWNLRNETKGKKNNNKTRPTNKQTLNYREQVVIIREVGRVMGEIGKGD